LIDCLRGDDRNGNNPQEEPAGQDKSPGAEVVFNTLGVKKMGGF